ncbi:hypothetical protein SKDZ_15G1780 [Saccharomyces kudriavzevii ZP591]|uniref:HST3-like protein n=3 Tax=Saccharomyces TaxID=4930 RepID=J5PYJ4_SACK1|nr:uncharacterized protein SKDI_15G1800 [Saccharomyces kudriavzevii IFO 1802]EHN00248.1 Hst3p [Saccharomyces cerevisiae x Saccharomyces kudriavzevii VIN7]EJT44418.1 HST3-like protein [Saccharomyces kudriavzevii IFO 1802]CAI4051256.1 hypothetical protein SKDI_15G1800 [Saccharomyces kudriavzevii IFO 1802]CAI4051271.1 hypothetical protein SKDZ_15G1780 [Saccharomyces kudriavzevii ZP591]
MTSVSPSPPASRSGSMCSDFSSSLQTEKLAHIMGLNSDDEVLGRITKQLGRSRKIACLTGAGISCNAGIPDFRSSDGLYNLVKKDSSQYWSIKSGREMFDISLFRDDFKISIFAKFMERLYSNVQLAKPTKTHKFIAHLKDRNKLLRCYTQNIDGLEENIGLVMSNRKLPLSSFSSHWRNLDVVQLHGDLNSLSCTKCFQTFSWNRYWSRCLRRGELPLCPHCEALINQRMNEGKRTLGSNVGVLRPNIVLYGENHPSCEMITQGLNLDIIKGNPDLLIIMGTSLKVDGVKQLVKKLSKRIHDRGGLIILVNKTPIGDSSWHGIIDYQIHSDCDNWVTFLESEIPDFFKTQDQINKLRQLKREASDLRRMMKAQKDSISTPPTTPLRTALHSDNDVLNVKITSLNKIKRKILSPENSSEEDEEENTNMKKRAKIRSTFDDKTSLIDPADQMN